uniref:Tetraspanin family protein n=1 Tax=Setaria digitata TaxID=48799 RepID=A0A915PQM6_9BILA
MPSVEYGRFGLQPTAINQNHSKHLLNEPKKLLQEMTHNSEFQLIGVTCLALGVYLCIKDPRPIAEWADVFLNPAVLLTIIGLAICIVSLMGSLGALRDNVALLKTLECCGVSSASQGYRDWQLSDQFNCNPANPYPERCGVPFSCCKRSVVSEAAAGSTNPLLPAMRSLQCWQNAQTKRPQELEADLHTRGCLQPLRILFESHAVHVGAAVAIVIIPVCISVCLSNILAKQIDHQRYLLKREARRCERRRRRNERNRFRDPYDVAVATNSIEPKCSTNTPRHNTGQNSDDSVAAINYFRTPLELASSQKEAEAGSTLHKSLSENMVGLESVKVTEPSLTVPSEKKHSALNATNLSHSPPTIPPHEPSSMNGDVRRHRKHCRPASNSPSKHIVQSSSSVIGQHQRISNGASVAAQQSKQKQRRRSLAATSPTKMTAENRTQQWVLEQSDLVGYEPAV